jgi:hypothetical protein
MGPLAAEGNRAEGMAGREGNTEEAVARVCLRKTSECTGYREAE